MAMFLMSMTNFGDYYNAFSRTEHEYEAKILFVIYMAIVAILLINMLIAMMGNTYQKIAETRNEWQRQWARIVLVVERGVSPPERLRQLNVYSQPMSDGKRALVLRLNQSVCVYYFYCWNYTRVAGRRQGRNEGHLRNEETTRPLCEEEEGSASWNSCRSYSYR